MPASVFGVMGGMCGVALFANVYKHGWHWPSVVLGLFLTTLTLSLAVRSERRTRRWAVRYWIAVLTFGTLGVWRFLL